MQEDYAAELSFEFLEDVADRALVEALRGYDLEARVVQA
jgi:hypothetical protein